MSQKQNIPGANWIAPADSKRFFDSSVVPSFLVRKVENKSFPCSHKLGERTGQVWQDNSRRVRTHEKNSGETVRRLGTTIQSIFVPNQVQVSAWIFGNSSVRVGTQGLFRPYLKTFVAPFLPTWLTAPWSPTMGTIAHGSIRLPPRSTRGCSLAIKADRLVESEQSVFLGFVQEMYGQNCPETSN